MLIRKIIGFLLLPVLLAGCTKIPDQESAAPELTVLIGTDGYGNVYRNTMEEFLQLKQGRGSF